MRVVRIATGEEIPIGSPVAEGLTLQGILAEPSPSGFSGGAFAGRLTLADNDGNIIEPLPFQHGLAIIP